MAYSYGVEVNLKDPNKSMSKVKRQDQIWGTCYAYAAAMALEAHQRTINHAWDYQIDPLYLATKYALEHKEKSSLFNNKQEDGNRNFVLEAGDMSLVSSQASNKEVCILNSKKKTLLERLLKNKELKKINEVIPRLLSFLHKQYLKLNYKFNDEYLDKLYPLELEKNSVMPQSSTKVFIPLINKANEEKSYDEKVNEFKTAFSEEFYNELSMTLKISLPEKVRKNIFEDIISFYLSLDYSAIEARRLKDLLSPLDFSFQLQKFICETKKITSIETYSLLESNKAKYDDKLDILIDYFKDTTKTQPIMASICVDGLVNGSKQVGNKLNVIKRYNDKNKEIDKCGRHAVLIIGVEKFRGGYKFLIRDNYPCTISNFKYSSCDNDQDSWVPASYLLNNLYNANIIKSLGY